MKIRIPYVVVTAVKGRAVDDIVFVDTASRKTCVENMKANDFRVGRYCGDVHRRTGRKCG